ncbi:Undecaprenyl-diphosphatase [Geoalkalibacter ferrihydriticus]|uniref:Undecaprenyl-diphosphatase n=2 Tax=Geoalkalibacter ferrihydriticus TaxID=392333 RepID=A0A0C2EFN8_9BACT|nr:undecaprenyl-diphosphate phosphatase [Geoalkalibacter ferrihydriticus]KIH77438.1 UDP pyrophosphate phosphatase [Geoalkalibacter ferrihydriticus DSM 17813]SDM14999.1 Undecaprenyl-diphosphatase [Geoalkalibacter ferrihydriticus]
MDFLQIFVLSVVQGLTEFLPISSSAHLILVPIFTAWEDQGLAFDIATHVGTLAAVMLYFRRDLYQVSVEWAHSLKSRRLTPSARLGWGILLGTIPVGLAGLSFKGFIETSMRSPVILACSLIGFAFVLSYADWRRRGARDEYSLTWKDILLIGCAQALALIPGTSRSGITMTAALLLGLNREGAARFSFLLSIPVTALAGGLQAVELTRSPGLVHWTPMILGALFSGISAFICIHYFLVFIRRIGMQPFVIYRIALGILLLVVFGPKL